MSYNPAMPFGQNTNQLNQQFQSLYQPKFDSLQLSDDLTWVNGLESVRMFQTKPNSKYVLFDLNEDILYIKQTDASNFPTITRYRYVKEVEDKPSEKYVTVEEFEKFKEDLLNAKQSTRSGTKRGGSTSRSSANKEHDADVTGE